MTDMSPMALRRKVESLRETEAELNFQSRRLQALGTERADHRMLALGTEYARALRTVTKLRVHQERRMNLTERGDAREMAP